MILKVILLSIVFTLPICAGISFSYFKNKFKILNSFITGLSFMLLIGLLVSDIIPNLVDKLDNYYDIGLLSCTQITAILALLFMEFFIPHHYHKHVEKDNLKVEHRMHMYHIGIFLLPLIITLNIYKGMTFTSNIINGVSINILEYLLIFLINFFISYLICTNVKSNKKMNSGKFATLSVSFIIGAITGYVFKNIGQPAYVIFLSSILGMILYSGIFELGVEASLKTKENGVLEGVLVGAIISALLLV